LGLRERQKAGRRAAILEAALRLFDAKGYEGATIQDIAALADLTVPTLYRYFRSKSELLVGLHDRLVAEVEDQGRRVLANLPHDPVRAIVRLLTAHLDMLGPGAEDNMRHWRMIAAAAIRQPDLFGSSYFTQDQRLMRQQRQLCAELKARGHVRDDADEDAFAELLNVIGRGAFRMRLGLERDSRDIARLIGAIVPSIYRGFSAEPRTSRRAAAKHARPTTAMRSRG
jgi:AcrR family transcriptional regulator